MWLGRTIRNAAADWENNARIGRVTISGNPMGVLRDAEHRDLRMASPGGYTYRPPVGQEVLTLSCAGGEDLVLGEYKETTLSWMKDGEVSIRSAGSAEIRLLSDGSIQIIGDAAFTENLSVTGILTVTGKVFLNGGCNIEGELIINGEAYRPCKC